MKVVIIGGGPAGMMAAISCKQNNPLYDVVILLFWYFISCITISQLFIVPSLYVPGKYIVIRISSASNPYEFNKFLQYLLITNLPGLYVLTSLYDFATDKSFCKVLKFSVRQQTSNHNRCLFIELYKYNI